MYEHGVVSTAWFSWDLTLLVLPCRGISLQRHPPSHNLRMRQARPHFSVPDLQRSLEQVKVSVGKVAGRRSVRGTRRDLRAFSYDLLFFCLLVVTFISLFSPEQRVVSTTLDSSWLNAYNYFAHTSMRFGTDVVFTYGPLSWLQLSAYDPDLYWSKVLFKVFIASYACAVIYLLRKQAGRLPAVLAAAGFIFSASHQSLELSLQLFTIFLILFRKSTSSWSIALGSTAVFVLFGTLGMMKFTFWISGFVLIALLVGKYLVSREWANGVSVLVAYILGTLVFWRISGQQLGDLPLYIYSSFEVAEGYAEGMAQPGPQASIAFAMALLALFPLVVPKGIWWNLRKNISSLVMILALIFLTFLCWKSGFVRHDLHSLTFFSFIASASGLLAAIQARASTSVGEERHWLNQKLGSSMYKAATWITVLDSRFVMRTTVILLLFGGISGYGHAINQDPRHEGNFVTDPTLSKIYELPAKAQYIIEPQKLVRDQLELEAELKKVEEESTLPSIKEIVADQTIDVYNYQQNYVLYNSLRWEPRPIFQSYAAFTPTLLRLNRESLLHGDAPEFILMNNETIDERFPLLDDGPWIREVLNNYTLVQQESDFLLLQRKGTVQAASDLTAEEQHSLALGKSMEIPEANELTLATLDIQYNLLGKLRALFLRAPEVYLSVSLSNGERKDYRVIPEMTKEPFLLSPLMETNQDLLLASAKMNPKEVVSIKVHSPGEKYFQSNIDVELYSEHIPEEFYEPDIYNPHPPLSELTPAASETISSMDQVSGTLVSQAEQPIAIPKGDGTIRVSGWAIDAEAENAAGGVYVEVDGELFPAFQEGDRGDVAERFGVPAYRDAGFVTDIPTSQIGPGAHELSLVVLSSDRERYYRTEHKVEIEVE